MLNNYSEDDTVTYKNVKTFKYLKESSRSVQDDIIVMPNVPLHAAGASMKDADSWTLMGFQAAIDLLQGNDTEPVFVRKTAHELIWGYDDKLTELASTFMPSPGLASSKFGLMVGQNNTPDGLYRDFYYIGRGMFLFLYLVKMTSSKNKISNFIRD